MSDDVTEELIALEERLRLAMLHSDLDELNELLDEALLFVGPDTRLYTKADDLESHRTGALSLNAMTHGPLTIEATAESAVVTVVSTLEGISQGQPFAGEFRYIRFWRRLVDQWKIVGGSACMLPPASTEST